MTAAEEPDVGATVYRMYDASLRRVASTRSTWAKEVAA